MTIAEWVPVIVAVGSVFGLDKFTQRFRASAADRRDQILKAARGAARDVAHLLMLKMLTAQQAAVEWERRWSKLLDQLGLHANEAERRLAFEEAHEVLDQLVVGVAVGELRDSIRLFRAEMERWTLPRKGWLP